MSDSKENADAHMAGARTDSRYALLAFMQHHNILGVADQGIVGLTSFVTVVLLGRAVTADELGVYSLALSVVLFVKMVQETMLAGPYTVFTHRLREMAASIYSGNTLIQSLLLTAAGTVCLIVFTAVLQTGRDPAGLAPVFTVLCLVFPVILLREFLRQIAYAHLQLTHALIMDACIAFIQICALMILMKIALLSAASAYLVIGLACGAGILVWLRQSKIRFSFTRDGFSADLLKNWSFGKWALGGQAIGTIMFYAMPWVLTAFHGTAAAGLLAACSSIVGLINTLLLGLGNVLTPRAAKSYAQGGHRELWHVLVKFLLLFLFSMGGFAFVLFIFGGLIADILFDGRYPDAGPVINILALNLIAGSFVMVAGNGLWALNRPSANFLAESCRLIVTLVLVFLLVPALDAAGAAYALLGGSIAGGLVSFLVLWRLIVEHES